MFLQSKFQHYFLFLILLGIASCSYLPEPYQFDSELRVEENSEFILLTSLNLDKSKSGIIFYPGGLVDPHAYINVLQPFAIEDNRAVVIVKTISNLAILNTQKANSIIDKLDGLSGWIVGGHSLGGSVACINISNQPNYFNALFLLASYSSKDISATNMPIISITGSNDLVLDKQKFEDNKTNLSTEIAITNPDEIADTGTDGTTIYYQLDGGNHAQFGNYGEQKGDGQATIDSGTQQSLVFDALQRFFLNNQL